MAIWDLNTWQWFVLLQHELLLFAAIFFIIGAIDDFALDLTWLGLRLIGRAKTLPVNRREICGSPLSGAAAIFIPTWQEERVIGATIKHILHSWPQERLVLYVGCYRNDAATITAAMQAASGDSRLRLVIHDREGPSTKADCLNRLYRALCADEERSGEAVRMVVFHDAEDMVDPVAINLLDKAIGRAQFVR